MKMEHVAEFNGLELRPYRYEELEEDGSLSVGVRVLLSGNQLEKFKLLIQQGPYYIVRRGRDENRRRVWISIDGWSTAVDGTKYQIIFTDYREDKELDLRYIDRLYNLIPLVIKQEYIIEQLSSLLIQKGILTKEEYKPIEELTPKRNEVKELELYRVDDLDKYKFRI
jgi:hypothetical protein